MNKLYFIFILIYAFAQAQELPEKGHYGDSPFQQLKQELPTPNVFRTASGAPGPNYYQQQADYEMKIHLDEDKNIIYGDQIITYTNNSPEALEYLWVQLDQNRRASDSPSYTLLHQEINENSLTVEEFSQQFREPKFDGGFKLEFIQDTQGNNLNYTVNQTMLRIDLNEALKTNEKFSFRVKWWYNINNYMLPDQGGRSGFELMEDGNKIFVIAQFFPRMAVYNDVEGWQNMQFWGRSEYALPFGNYDVSISVPDDHILNATGKLVNEKDVLTTKQYNRLQQAWKSFDKPVMIVNEAEATQNEKSKSNQMKTWRFKAENVRDFAFSSSRKFIWDAMAVNLGENDVIAMSLYPREANPLWEEYSTRTVAHTLKEYSKLTFEYPYHKAVSVSAEHQGMEYPMICWNYGRPDKNGFVADDIKFGMISVIIHEIGHNFFPMIVNSDERQWTWMDEGLNIFLQYTAEQNIKNTFPYIKFPDGMTHYPSRRGGPQHIVEYMSRPQNLLEPIMTQGENIKDFGSNAYGKPGSGLVILRNTIMGKEAFDHAFKTYANRWKFKHPTPADFFRTMEDASAIDLDWFWRGWFFTTWYVDMGISDVKSYSLISTEDKKLKFIPQSAEINPEDFKKMKELQDFDEQLKINERNKLSHPTYFYEVTYNRPGKMIMPLLVRFEFKDGTYEDVKYSPMIWRLNENEITKVYAFEKELEKIIIDIEKEIPDINLDNNIWSLN